jgi:hypothetical protein
MFEPESTLFVRIICLSILLGTLLVFLGCASDTETASMPMANDGGGALGNTGVSQPDLGLEPLVLPPCADDRLPSTYPTTLMGSTAEGEDRVGPAPCVAEGTSGSNDWVAAFVAPKAGTFRFSTLGSDFDTVLHARAATCDGEMLACNDDANEQSSGISVALEAGQVILLVVDGFNRQSGHVVLAVEGKESQCDDGLDGDNDGAIDCADTDCFLNCENPMDWPAAWGVFEDEVLVETNRARAAGATCDQDVFAPAGPLEMNEFLRYSARLHARDMGTNNYFEHASQDGRTPTERMRQAGFEGGGPTGENIAAGQKTPAAVVEGWMNSPGHCRNIMDPDYRIIGVGFSLVEGSSFGEYWVQNFGGSH